MLILHKKIQFYNILHQFRLNAKLLQRCYYIRCIATFMLQKNCCNTNVQTKHTMPIAKKTTEKRKQWSWQQTDQDS